MLDNRIRYLERIVLGRETTDGVGVRLTRVLTRELQARLDPFLMLDAFRTARAEDYQGGFPDHPHRGFETVTYMIAGQMRHHDSGGNQGLIGPGGAQWMVAGSGLIHSEFPEQSQGLMEGFQLWLNLPAKDKMISPAYRDIPAEAIPQCVLGNGVMLRVIAGECAGVQGAVRRPVTEPLLVDVHLPAGAALNLPLPVGFNAFLYVYRGELVMAGGVVPDRAMGILSNEGGTLEVVAPQGARAIVVAARPLGEPIAQHGPFVMNTPQQIEEALADYRAGEFDGARVGAL